MSVRQRLSERRRLASRQRGYVLVIVLAALALIAFIAGRFANRIESLRAQTMTVRDAAAARAEASSARAAALFWLATQPGNANGYGDGIRTQWVADGRWYRLGKSALVSLQDQRGLLSVNLPDRNAMARLLQDEGVSAERVSALLDVLEDYTDEDNLKRLNGGEAPEYRQAGLFPPRNDWMLSVLELRQMLSWRDDPMLCERLAVLVSTRRNQYYNPYTSPLPVLRAMAPAASIDQLKQFVAMRKAGPLIEGYEIPGVQADADNILLHVSDELLLRVWVPGLPRVFEYNLRLHPGGVFGPWSILESHTVSTSLAGIASEPPVVFPDPSYPVPSAR